MNFRAMLFSAATLGLVVAAGCAYGNGGSFRQADSALNRRTFAQWRDHIRPRKSELTFERIPWIPRFGDGLVRADAEAKPLLLWVMNGHPLGCT